MAGIGDLMVTEMITALPYDTVAEAVKRMCANKVGAILIVEQGQLVGLFSERDLLTRVVEAHRDARFLDVGSVATRDPVTVDVSASVRSVLQVFREHKFRHLPVLRNGAPVGILSTRDFLDFLVEGLERHIDTLRYQRDLAAGQDPYDHLGGAYGR
jgi:CBS domain-containing protein